MMIGKKALPMERASQRIHSTDNEWKRSTINAFKFFRLGAANLGNFMDERAAFPLIYAM